MIDIQRNTIKALKKFGLLKERELLRNYTTLRTGGPADILIYPDGIESIPGIVRIAETEDIPLTVIGGGSNLLIGDKGIDGIVIRLSGDGIASGDIKIDKEGIIYADAIVSKEDFIEFSVNAGYGGMEFMAGIPGCIGGGIIMNAGTELGSFADIIEQINIVDGKGRSYTIEITEKMLSYRGIKIRNDSIVTGGYFRLTEAEDPALIKKRIEEILEDRRSKHPLDFPSAGSVFKNPVGYSSWRLIEDAGLKGKRIGGAVVSDIHTNFIININNATSMDIRNLIELIQYEVHKKFEIELETEIKMIGGF